MITLTFVLIFVYDPYGLPVFETLFFLLEHDTCTMRGKIGGTWGLIQDNVGANTGQLIEALPTHHPISSTTRKTAIVGKSPKNTPS